jgi:hypothetical protein
MLFQNDFVIKLVSATKFSFKEIRQIIPSGRFNYPRLRIIQFVLEGVDASKRVYIHYTSLLYNWRYVG